MWPARLARWWAAILRWYRRRAYPTPVSPRWRIEHTREEGTR